MSDALSGFFEDINAQKELEKMTADKIKDVVWQIRIKYTLTPIEKAVLKYLTDG